MARFGFVLRVVSALVVVLAVSFVSAGSAGAVSHVGTVAGTGNPLFNGDLAATETNIDPWGLVFDPVGGDIHFIDSGSRIRKVTQDGKIETVAGTGKTEFNGDLDATKTNIHPHELVFDPVNRELYFNDNNSRIRKVTKDGKIETVAGTGNKGFNGDLAATKTNIDIDEMVFNPVGGELHFIDARLRIRQVTEDGKVKTVAGTGEKEFNGDLTATETNIRPQVLVFDPVGGEPYFIDHSSRIRKVTEDGKVKTVAGTGEKEFNGDLDARQTNINPWELAFDPVDHELYFIDDEGSRIRKVTKNDKIETVAGTGYQDSNGNLTALETNIYPWGKLVFDPVNGELYFRNGAARIRKITSDGKIETVAGTDKQWFNGDLTATETNIRPQGLVFDPVDGDLYFTDGFRIRVLFENRRVPDLKRQTAEAIYDDVERARKKARKFAEKPLNDLLSDSRFQKRAQKQAQQQAATSEKLLKLSASPKDVLDLVARAGSRAYIRKLRQELEQQHQPKQAHNKP